MKNKIAIVGLGYVGLPLAVEFSKCYTVVGYDIDEHRINELKNFKDSTSEVTSATLKQNITKDLIQNKKGLFLSCNELDLESSNIYIITVPTPIYKSKQPNLTPLLSASRIVGKYLIKNDIVIYESTVFPGCTEEECVPVLEKASKLKYNDDFFCGYSPERINPGDKVNTLTKIKKVTSGSTPQIAVQVNELYNEIIDAGTHLAPSIKVAEASKSIENAQRDLNISFVNELSLIFDRLGIDTNDVLAAAGTKWNFLKFKPGLVGGHCISVDPYYLTFKAEQLGYYPDVILSGRRVNDNMPSFIVSKLIKLMIGQNIRVKRSNVLVLGVTFKENCPDIRNTKIYDIVNELEGFSVNVDVFDPVANEKEVLSELGLQLIKEPKNNFYDGIILAVAHENFSEYNITNFTKEGDKIIFDLKSFLDRDIVDARL